MYSYIKGSLASKSQDKAVIDVGGVGYLIYIPYSTYQTLPELNEVVKLNTYLAVREDSLTLYGFNSNEELRVFELLISVSGIGPKLAMGILSDISAADFSVAVITDDVNRLTKISGIGKKTAQRMIIELKDKMKSETIENMPNEPVIRNVVNNEIEEAISALQVLGYNNKDAVDMVNKTYKEGMGIEEILKMALKG
ncbi:MAG: Holliday junction branch migration protein RuvA [Clostridiales bacterium]|nr:Holliday junction branch migration protein RuvA [Clostridiales bacterium]